MLVVDSASRQLKSSKQQLQPRKQFRSIGTYGIAPHIALLSNSSFYCRTQNIIQGLDVSSVCVRCLHVCECVLCLYLCRIHQLPATDIKADFHYDLLRKEFAFRWPFECLPKAQLVQTEWTVCNRVVQMNGLTAIKDSIGDVSIQKKESFF